MTDELDDKFFDRADAHIDVSNQQTEAASQGQVSASMMYATARYNAYVTARNHASAEKMAEDREETIEYFMQEYRLMLEENLDDYIQNFDSYMKPVN